jgi:serine/threonine-protein kinase
MSQVRYQPLGPLLSGEGSRAFLGLALEEGAAPTPVVLIWAPQEVAQDPELIDKLRRETNRAVVFDHPHILRVHGLAQLDQGLARVTEYADGETLRRVMEVTPRIPPPLAAKIVADAAMGIHYAHMAGNDDGTPLVHGDVRPETLIISFTGVCKVTGYGALGVAPRERGGRRVRNRRKYSAPEQLLGGRDAVNIQTDVFLLGLTLYELLTGKIPFKDAKDADTATLTEALPSLPLNIPRGLDAVVHKATAKRANERYPTALALREAIVEAMGDLPQQDVLMTFMNRLFPASDEARSARSKVLEFGIAEAIKHSGTAKPATGSAPTVAPAAPAPAPVSSTKSPTIPPASAPKPQAPAAPPSTGNSATVRPAAPAAPAPISAPQSSPQPPVAASPGPAVPVPPPAAATAARSRFPLVLVAVSLALISVAAAVVVGRDRIPLDIPGLGGLLTTDPSQVVTPPPPADPMAFADGGVPADAGVPADEASMAAADAGTDGGTDAGVELELIVDPRVEAFLPDGGPLGRTPVTVPLTPGRYLLSLSNSALGIQTSRTVTVNPEGRTTVRIYLSKGFVNVTAPEGATVQVDGRNVGKAPVDELDLYEGVHRLVVIVNGARWQKSFLVEPNQRVNFSVDFEDEDTE